MPIAMKELRVMVSQSYVAPPDTTNPELVTATGEIGGWDLWLIRRHPKACPIDANTLRGLLQFMIERLSDKKTPTGTTLYRRM